jgi:DNA/RNA endonuclease YhcR with UshA esterase domain
MTLRASASLAVVVLMLTVPVSAHHSLATFWDVNKSISITGIVKSVKLVNPHANMIVEVTDASGQKSDWSIVARGSVSLLRQLGWKEDTVTPGMKVTVEGNPSRNPGAKGVAAGTITRPDGSVVTFGAIPRDQN